MYIIAKMYDDTMDYVDVRGRIVKDINHCRNNRIAVCSPMVYHKESNISKKIKVVGPEFKKIPLEEILKFLR